MPEIDGQPAVGAMALITLQAGDEVSARLTRGRIAIVAGRTGTGRDAAMIE